MKIMEPRISIITLCVEDMGRSYDFYTNVLGLETPQDRGAPIYFFKTSGTTLAIYPLEQMKKEFAEGRDITRGAFPGFTLAHNTKLQEDVDRIIDHAVQNGATLVKKPQDVFWGGYSGYFEDPDGYLWEIAYADTWAFHNDGSLIIE